MYLFGEPQDFAMGDGETVKVRFLSYKEYLINMGYLSLMNQDVLHIYYQYQKVLDIKDKKIQEALETLKNDRLFNIVSGNAEFASSYLKIFATVLDMHSEIEVESALTRLFEDEQLFIKMRELVLDMQMLVADEVSPNPEIQKGIEISRKIKSSGKDSPTFADIVSSIVAGTSNSFTEVCNMTVIQVYSLFYRIGAFKNYDTSTLFATVSPDISIESWNKKIDMYETNGSTISKKDFDKTYGKLMK